MSDIVHGEDVSVLQLIDGNWLEIGCATDCTFEFINELINKTSRNSPGFREKKVRISDIRGSVNGVIKTTNDGDVLSIFWFLSQGVNRIEGTFKFLFTDEDGNDTELTLTAIVESIQLRGPVEGHAEFDLNLEGTGGHEMDSLDVPGSSADNVDSDTFTIAGGLIQDNRLIGATIIGVWREGTELTSMGVTYVHNSVTGEITPDAATTIDGQKLFVIWLT